MRIYALPPIIEEQTDHWVIDDPNKPAYPEILSSIAIYIIEPEENGFLVNHYNKTGNWFGDTWHRTTEDAKHQVEFEYKSYDNSAIEWKEIPEKEENPIEYVLSQLDKKF